MFFDSVKKELTTNYYDEGMQAYKSGKEMWECPHVYPTSLTMALTPWLAGWMAAKQMEANLGEEHGMATDRDSAERQEDSCVRPDSQASACDCVKN